MSRRIAFSISLALGLSFVLGLFLVLNPSSIPPARAQILPSSVITETMKLDYGWKVFSTSEVTRTMVTSTLSATSAVTSTAIVAAYPPGPGRVEIYSSHEIPVDGDGNFVMGPSTDFWTPFTLTQAFGNPHIPETNQIYGTIAPGWCEYAEFLGATAGYNTGSYPTQACSWIEWTGSSIPDVITVSVRYKGCWSMGIYSMVAWRVRYPDEPSGIGQTFCLVGEPVGNNCPEGWLLFEPQTCFVYLPMILKNR